LILLKLFSGIGNAYSNAIQKRITREETMEIVKELARPEIIGPMIGLFAVIGWIVTNVAKRFFEHQERMEKIRMGINPDLEEIEQP
jgi:hypothetical protein